ncbi:MAG: GNAT family N-acetyltransferase [Myxococcota bacterium]
MTYEVIAALPSIDDYCRLREVSGLSPRARAAAERGLPRSLFSVVIRSGPHTVGMGRVVGDGGCNFEVVDIAVDPDHQGRGLGRMLMDRIAEYLREEVPDSGFVSLLADGESHHLYAKYGFEFTACRGMSLSEGCGCG